MLVWKPYGLSVSVIWWLIGLVVLTTLIPAFVLARTALWGSRLEYRLDDNALSIVWGRPVVIPLRDITAIRLAPDRPRPYKVTGTGTGGLHVGLYQLPGTGRLQLYADRLDRHLVIIETRDGRRFGITPEEPESFVAELNRRRGAT